MYFIMIRGNIQLCHCQKKIYLDGIYELSVEWWYQQLAAELMKVTVVYQTNRTEDASL
jgi:hypothetical protein